jgi:hypothetical protein
MTHSVLPSADSAAVLSLQTDYAPRRDGAQRGLRHSLMMLVCKLKIRRRIRKANQTTSHETLEISEREAERLSSKQLSRPLAHAAHRPLGTVRAWRNPAGNAVPGLFFPWRQTVSECKRAPSGPRLPHHRYLEAAAMKRYRDPTPAIEPPRREELPLSEWVKAVLVVAAVLGMVAASVWIDFRR